MLRVQSPLEWVLSGGAFVAATAQSSSQRNSEIAGSMHDSSGAATVPVADNGVHEALQGCNLRQTFGVAGSGQKTAAALKTDPAARTLSEASGSYAEVVLPAILKDAVTHEIVSQSEVACLAPSSVAAELRPDLDPSDAATIYTGGQLSHCKGTSIEHLQVLATLKQLGWGAAT